jgi:uncharacterized protein YbjQ (UPF0145 family)
VQLSADAVIGVDVDYESIQIGHGSHMLMVSASGIVERLERALVATLDVLYRCQRRK